MQRIGKFDRASSSPLRPLRGPRGAAASEAQARPALLALWRALVTGEPFAPPKPLDESEVSWAIETGMGPLLHAAAEASPGSVPADLATRLRIADRWARVHHADALEAALEIVDRCAERVAPLTLLKGISICDEVYPSPHQRVVGDLDFLVEQADAAALEAALRELGYRPPEAPPERDYATHHHLQPVRHPRTGISIEVHTGLLPPEHRICDRVPFSPDAVLAERRAATLEGRPVYRLSPELQVAYIASHWALDFIPTAGPRALLDMILLLRAAGDRIEWARVIDWLEDRRIAAHLQLMLGYLESQELVDLPRSLRTNAERITRLPPPVLGILMEMIDRYQVRGMMRSAPPLPTRRPGYLPSKARGSGTLRSRLRTLRLAGTTGNLRGLLQPADTFVWEKLLGTSGLAWGQVLGPLCRLLPPGDPDRLTPRHQLARVVRSVGSRYRRNPT